MKRYRVTYSTTRAGEFSEFSAPDDTAAIAHVHDAARYGWGAPASLAEVTGATTQRTIDITTPATSAPLTDAAPATVGPA